MKQQGTDLTEEVHVYKCMYVCIISVPMSSMEYRCMYECAGIIFA